MLEPYQRFDNAVQYVEANYQGPVRLADLAALTDLSESQFSRRFKSVFHMTPARYLAKTRIAKACVALLASDAPVTTVALDVGFCDHSYFTRRFRAHVGMTPSDYRRRFAAGGR
ncbi:MAG: helix-turn-helix domain-containing protein [Planctomycetota bacterium]